MASRDLIAASTEPLILSILTRGESYGYAIADRAKTLSKGELTWTEGMLYPVLHRMERRGWIKSKWGKSETGRKRRYYSLTPKGKEALAKRQREWLAVHDTLVQSWGLSCG